MSRDLSAQLQQPYEEVPYESRSFAHSAPEHLEAVARLFGLPARPPAKARVLELGCASGGNLLPFAARYPDAQAVGIDLSAMQIEEGRRTIARAGLKNVALRQLNLEEIDDSLGEFDYVICHGVYSRVPPTVQAAILRIASKNLTPNGVAYISYNTYPGWKAREIVRDAMLFRSAGEETQAKQLAYARGTVEFLHDMAGEGSVLKRTLEDAMPLIQDQRQGDHLIHEFLEGGNTPCYFKDFVASANAQGLAYLGDAEPSTMFVSNYGAKVAEPLLKECGRSQVLMEQYLDFLVNRQFRQTILVKKDREQNIRHRLEDQNIRGLEFAAHFQSESDLKLDSAPEVCKAWRNVGVTLRTPVQKAVARALNTHYPATLSVSALARFVGQAARQPQSAVIAGILSILSELIVIGAVRYRCTPVRAPAAVPAYPQVSLLARSAPGLDAAPGAPMSVCNAWHEEVSLSALQRTLLPMLDGKHDEEELVVHLLSHARDCRVHLLQKGVPISNETEMERCARQQLPDALEALRRLALLSA